MAPKNTKHAGLTPSRYPYGRHLPLKALKILGYTDSATVTGMVIDVAKIQADGVAGNYNMTEEEFVAFVIDNEMKAYDFSNNAQYQAATNADKQKMELADQQANQTGGVSQQLVQDAVKTANDPNSVYNNPAQIRTKASDLQLPPGAVRIIF